MTISQRCFKTHWGRATHICVGKLTFIGSDNSLSPGRRLAIIWTIVGILLIGPSGTNFSEILIGIQTFSFKKSHLKTSSAKWRLFCLGLNGLNNGLATIGTPAIIWTNADQVYWPLFAPLGLIFTSNIPVGENISIIWYLMLPPNLVVTWWCHMASRICVIIGPSLFIVRHQAINWSNGKIWSIGNLGTNVSENWIKLQIVFAENTFENISCKMTAIFLRLSCTWILSPSRCRWWMAMLLVIHRRSAIYFPRHSGVQYLLLIYKYIYIFLLTFVYLSMYMLNCLLFVLIIKWARYLHTITICIRNMCCISYHCSTQCNTFVEIMIRGFIRLRCSIKLHDRWRWYPEAY